MWLRFDGCVWVAELKSSALLRVLRVADLLLAASEHRALKSSTDLQVCCLVAGGMADAQPRQIEILSRPVDLLSCQTHKLILHSGDALKSSAPYCRRCMA